MNADRPTGPDTIVAIASPPGRSPRGLLRLCGPGAGAVLRCLLADVPPAMRQLVPVRLRQPDLPALLLRFAAPSSYTGEDAAELQVPGNAALLDRLLHRAIAAPAANARLAEPGEFTFRAYTAGKLDLTQAEGVAATISATSDSQLRAATLLREGDLGRAAHGMVEAIGTLLALVEAGIDFTDQEDVVPIAPALLRERLAVQRDALKQLLHNSRPWGAIDALPQVVLVGPPSAGKSTLFNALLGRERVVIDPLPGTTRDVITEPITVTTPTGREVELMLVDIAGLDTPGSGLLDKPVQEAAHAAIRRADMVLSIHPADAPPEERQLPETPAEVISVMSKADLLPPGRLPTGTGLCLSAEHGTGMDALRYLLGDRLEAQGVSVTGDMLVLQPRHEAALQAAAEQLDTTIALLDGRPDARYLPDIELFADGLRGALDALAMLGGRLTPDEVIGRVFATFCVGK